MFVTEIYVTNVVDSLIKNCNNCEVDEHYSLRTWNTYQVTSDWAVYNLPNTCTIWGYKKEDTKWNCLQTNASTVWFKSM